MSQIAFAFTLAHELYGRLRWFVNLRWLAVLCLAAAALFGPRLSFPDLRPGLFYVAAAVMAYNLVFLRLLRSRPDAVRSPDFLKTAAILQIALDLTALLVTVHFSGSLASPILPFFVFHMVIGTLLLSTRTMYLIAALVCAATLVMHLAERTGLLPRHASTLWPDVFDSVYNPSVVVLAVTVFGTVYLTGRITARLRQGSLRLLETTMSLGDKTAQLERALEEIHEIERRKSHYMRLSAHQLRSPLGTIKTTLDAITQGYVDCQSERGRRLIEGAVERAEGLLLIVNDLLNLAKIREGQKTALWEQKLDVTHLLSETLDSLQPFARMRDVRVETESMEPGHLDWGVREDLRFAFENLLHNAIKYSHSGGTVRVALSAAGDRLRLVIADEGIGIPDAIRSDVFLEFIRAPNAKHHAGEGTGLGLSIAREAVEIHGGKVTLDSTENVGTTVTIELPIHFRPQEQV